MKQNDAAAAKRLKRQKDILKKGRRSACFYFTASGIFRTFYLRDFRFHPGGADH